MRFITSLALLSAALLLGSAAAHATTCTISTSRETVSCDAGAPVWVATTTGTGMVVGIDLSGYSYAIIRGGISGGSGWLLNLGDSPTNNGYCGDAGTTSNDSELWITGTNVYLCDSDRGGSDYLWTWTGALSATSAFQIMVADGAVSFQNRGTGAYKVYGSDTVFQVDGDEPDAEAGTNDTRLWLGLNRVISGPGSRTGSGMGDLTVSLF